MIIPMPPGKGQWEQRISYLQALMCVQEGELVGTPTLDEYNGWRCVLRRFSAGVMVIVTVALIKQAEDWRIFVLEVNSE